MAYSFQRGLSGGLQGAGAGAALGPWGAVAGGALGLLGGLGGNPEDKANDYLKKIPGVLNPLYQPYVNAGNFALPQMQQQFGQLLSDPNAIINRIGAGYQKSPGYDFRLQQGENAINNANAAGGMLGTNQHQQQAGELAGNLASEDYEKYLNHGLGLYGAGLQGITGMGQMGQTASSDLATSLAQALMSQAGLNYAGQNNENQGIGGALGNFFGFGSNDGSKGAGKGGNSGFANLFNLFK